MPNITGCSAGGFPELSIDHRLFDSQRDIVTASTATLPIHHSTSGLTEGSLLVASVVFATRPDRRDFMAAKRARGNRLLTALPKGDYKILSPMLEHVPLVYNETIYEAGKLIRHIYFPASGIISLLSGVSENSTIEVGIVGNEGMAGLPVYLGVQTSSTRALVQGSGSALRMGTSDFLKFSARSSKLQALMLRYMHSLFTQVSQSAACNRFHPIDERLARWLMMTRDRVGSSEFQITQEFLSNMLGVRREAVNKAAGLLQERGLVSYLRGNMKIIDRKGLERAACTCYKIIKAEYDWKLN